MKRSATSLVMRCTMMVLITGALGACGGGSGNGQGEDQSGQPDTSLDVRSPDTALDAIPSEVGPEDVPAPDGSTPDSQPIDLNDVTDDSEDKDHIADELETPDLPDTTPDSSEVVEGEVISVTSEQPEVPLPDPESYQFVDRISFVSRILVPKASEGVPCCFDFTGDGVIDNQANEFLDLLGATLDPAWIKLTDSLQASIDEDRTSYVLEFTKLSSDGTAAAFSIWPSEGDLDWNGLPDQTPAERFEGLGVFGINPMGFTPFSPVSQFTVASFSGGKLKALGGRITARIAMQGGDYLPLVIRKLSLHGPLLVSDQGIATEDVSQNDPQITPSLQGGGVIDIKEVIQFFNEVAPTCECAELDPALPLFSLELKGGKLHVECLQDIVQTAAMQCSVAQHGFICGSIGNICVGVGLIGGVADASTGDLGVDGVPGKDAISFGGYFSLSPATLAVPTVGPQFKAVDDQFLTPAFFGKLKLDVLGNDIDALTGAPSITAITQPAEGTVEILPGGKALAYSVPMETWGEYSFSYTMSAAGQSSTATVLVHIPLPEGTVCVAQDDVRTILLHRGPQRVDGLLDNDYIVPGNEGLVVIAAGLSWQEAHVAVSADQKALIVEPLSAWQDGNTTTIGYGINLGQGPYILQSSAEIAVTYQNPEVICGDGWVDGWANEECDPGTDLLDPQCTADCHMVLCADGYSPDLMFADTDGDGYGNPNQFVWACEWVDGYVMDNTDCNDTVATVYPGQSELCGDSLNNGCRLTYDCGNEQCALEASCREVECNDGLDNDENGRIDCADPSCEGVEVCTDWDCGDGLDNEGDGLVDCDDLEDCMFREPCSEGTCDDGIDGDNDGLTDCKDTDDCQNTWVCREQICNDNIDNDEDGLTDCDDLNDCGWSWDCSEGNCTDSEDNDSDGLTDCLDPDCDWHPTCGG